MPSTNSPRTNVLGLLISASFAVTAVAQTEPNPNSKKTSKFVINEEVQAGDIRKRKFDPPRIIQVIRPQDGGNVDPNTLAERLYYMNKGRDVNINRGDILNVYRQRIIHPDIPKGIRIFIGTMTIIDSQAGSSVGVFSPNVTFDSSLIKFKVPLKNDLVVPRLNIDSGILFNPGQYALNTGAEVEFQKVADFIELFSPTKILVEGHTDSDGAEETNQTLSENRANIVSQYLIATYDFITFDMIESKGFGEKQPVAPNDTPENKKLNRRIQIVVWE